jgi:putative Mn2+ efflux pump MntP
VSDESRAVKTDAELPPPPASPVWTMPLRLTPYNRTIGFFRALFPIVTAVGLIDFIVSQLDPDRNLAGNFILLAVMWHAGAALACLGILMIRPAFTRTARLDVDPEGVTIIHPGVLRRPLRITKSDIRLAAVDSTVPRRQFHVGPRDHRRFPITAPHGYGGPPLPEYLYSRVGGSPFPLISHVGDPPNVLLLLNRPEKLNGARRTHKVMAAKGPIHLARLHQESHGLLLRVAEPEQARRAFHQHELLSNVTGRDVLAVGPGPAQQERARTYNTRANLLVGAIILLNFGPLMLIEGVGPTQNSVLPISSEIAPAGRP